MNKPDNSQAGFRKEGRVCRTRDIDPGGGTFVCQSRFGKETEGAEKAEAG